MLKANILVVRIETWIAAWFAANTPPKVQAAIPCPVLWSLPPIRAVKIKVDAALHHEVSVMVVGIVGHGDYGMLLLAISYSF